MVEASMPAPSVISTRDVIPSAPTVTLAAPVVCNKRSGQLILHGGRKISFTFLAVQRGWRVRSDSAEESGCVHLGCQSFAVE